MEVVMSDTHCCTYGIEVADSVSENVKDGVGLLWGSPQHDTSQGLNEVARCRMCESSTVVAIPGTRNVVSEDFECPSMGIKVETWCQRI
jgi:hypothetical protein